MNMFETYLFRSCTIYLFDNTISKWLFVLTQNPTLRAHSGAHCWSWNVCLRVLVDWSYWWTSLTGGLVLLVD